MTSDSNGRRGIYRFSDFEVDPHVGELRKRGIRIRIQDQPLKILTALIKRPGELIPREELQRTLWPGEVYVDSEHGLDAALTRLRQTLGDSAQTPRFVESIPRRGYRFIASVECRDWGPKVSSRAEVTPAAPEEPANNAASEPALAESILISTVPNSGLASRPTTLLLLAAVGAIAVLTSIVVLAIAPNTQRVLQAPLRFALFPSEGTRFAELEPIVVSSDGRSLVFPAIDASGETYLWVRQLSTLDNKRLDGTSGASFPFWSADGRSIGFFADGKLKSIDAMGGSPKTICEAISGRGGTWSREGIIVFAPDLSSPLLQVSSHRGEPKPLTHLDSAQGGSSHRWPFFLPDGQHFLYSVRHFQPDASGIFMGDLRTGRGVLLLKENSNAAYAAGSSGREFILFGRKGTLMMQGLVKMKPSGDAVPVAEGMAHSQYVEPLHSNFSVSGNGVLVYRGVRVTDRLTWFDRNGVRLEEVTGLGSHLHVTQSPDERAIAFEDADPHNGNYHLWVLDKPGGAAHRLTFGEGNETGPVWSPDSNRIAFAARRSSIFDLYERQIGGDGREKLLLRSDHWKFPTAWSRDGRFLLYYEINPEGKRRDVWSLALSDGAKPLPLLQTAANETDAVFSPDVKWFAYSSDETGKQEIYVQSFPPSSAKWMISNNGGSRPVWPALGNEIYYLAPDNSITAVKIETAGGLIRAGVPHVLFQTEMPDDFRTIFSVSPDGRRFLIPRSAGRNVSPSASVALNWIDGMNP